VCPKIATKATPFHGFMPLSGPIDLSGGEPTTVKSPTDVGPGKAMDEKAPLSAVITVLNERFETDFSEEDTLFFEQIKEKASKDNKSSRRAGQS
jgi:type I restriction enzyme, R subunit